MNAGSRLPAFRREGPERQGPLPSLMALDFVIGRHVAPLGGAHIPLESAADSQTPVPQRSSPVQKPAARLSPILFPPRFAGRFAGVV
jgi:hypothetical protein